MATRSLARITYNVRIVVCFSLSLFSTLCFSTFCFSAEKVAQVSSGNLTPIDAEDQDGGSNYFYSLKDDGTPEFTQNLTWDKVEYVSKYELEVQDSSGVEIYRGTSVENTQPVHLGAGTYRYRVTLYNLLEKPELTGDWIPLEIKKAEHPVIDSFSPGNLFLDEEKFTVTVYGEDLLTDARVYLVDPILGIKFFVGVIQQNDENKRLDILLPWNKLDTGFYKIKVINRGGLTAISPETMRISLQNPFEFFAIGGYAPYIPLYEKSYVDVWSSGFYPLGAQARATFIYSKKRFGYFGIELSGGAKYLQTTTKTSITVDMGVLSAGLGFLYKYRITPKYFLIGRIGTGLAWTTIDFTYKNISGLSMASMDPLLYLGTAFQYLRNKHWLFEVSVDYLNIFYKGQTAGSIVPGISAGYLF